VNSRHCPRSSDSSRLKTRGAAVRQFLVCPGQMNLAEPPDTDWALATLLLIAVGTLILLGIRDHGRHA